jgi:hypothetical protein
VAIVGRRASETRLYHGTNCPKLTLIVPIID